MIVDATSWAHAEPYGWFTGAIFSWFIGWAVFGVIAGVALSRQRLLDARAQVIVVIGGWLIAALVRWIVPLAFANAIEAVACAVQSA